MKKIAVNAMINVKQVITVYLYPNLSLTYPLMNNPIISPTFAPFDNPDCHAALI